MSRTRRVSTPVSKHCCWAPSPYCETLPCDHEDDSDTIDETCNNTIKPGEGIYACIMCQGMFKSMICFNTHIDTCQTGYEVYLPNADLACEDMVYCGHCKRMFDYNNQQHYSCVQCIRTGQDSAILCSKSCAKKHVKQERRRKCKRQLVNKVLTSRELKTEFQADFDAKLVTAIQDDQEVADDNEEADDQDVDDEEQQRKRPESPVYD